jgi:biopolymer transport protein ExbD
MNEPPEVVEVGVSAEGIIMWDGNHVANRQELESRIAEAANMDPQPEVHVRPDRAARYEIVAMVMASSQRLGLTKIGLTGNEQFAE